MIEFIVIIFNQASCYGHEKWKYEKYISTFEAEKWCNRVIG